MQPGHTERMPGHGYYKCLQEGYHAHGVPTKQIKRAARRAKNVNEKYYLWDLPRNGKGATILA